MGLIVVAFVMMSTSCTHDLKENFKYAALNNPRDLSHELVECALKEKINKDITPSIMALHLFEYQKSCTFLVEYYRAWGGHHSYYMLHSIDRSSEKIGSTVISETQLDEGGGFVTELKIVQDSVLEVVEQYVKLDENGKELLGKREYQYFLVNGAGHKKIETEPYNSERSYDASSRIFEVDELLELNMTNLDIMRNEIFASRGYKFTSVKWQGYFEKKSWYLPQFEDVNDKLSIIERINVERILKVSQSK